MPPTVELEPPDGGIETLSEDVCRELLASRELGRIAFQAANEIEIFPVNYSTDGTIVVFRTGPGIKLALSRATRVAFEVDEWNAATEVGWSVVLKGVAEEVTLGTDPFATVLRARPVVPLAPGEHDYWIAIYPATISGRRFHGQT
jgi:uncharacterized protein